MFHIVLECLNRYRDAHANSFFFFDLRLTENTDSQFETFNLTLVSSWGDQAKNQNETNSHLFNPTKKSGILRESHQRNLEVV